MPFPIGVTRNKVANEGYFSSAKSYADWSLYQVKMFGDDVYESVKFGSGKTIRHATLERFVSGVAKGNVKKNELPLPNSLSTHIFPP